jgi:hypothetical protein
MAPARPILAILLAASAGAVPAETVTNADGGELAVAVTSPADVDRSGSPRLVLRRRRWPGRDGGVAGWEIEVTDRRRPAAGNLLYHSRTWHGPYPTQFAAELHGSGQFPAERRLPVHGHRWEIVASCEDCAVTGEGRRADFVRGTLHVRWRRR